MIFYSFSMIYHRMGWQGSPDVVIDRFDVRAHLDYIPDVKHGSDEEMSYDDRLINYERYRILAQNDFLGGYYLEVSNFSFIQLISIDITIQFISSERRKVFASALPRRAIRCDS